MSTRDEHDDPAERDDRDLRADDRDELPRELADALAAAWHEHPAPDATPPLSASDDATRASVQWMRDSWAQLQAPPVDVPAALRRRMSRRRAEILPWRRHAAAAALLFTVGMALRFGAGWLPAPAQVVPPIDAGSTTPMTSIDPMRPHLVAAHADHLELRSGPVRLLLVTSTEPPPLDTNPSLGSDLR